MANSGMRRCLLDVLFKLHLHVTDRVPRNLPVSPICAHLSWPPLRYACDGAKICFSLDLSLFVVYTNRVEPLTTETLNPRSVQRRQVGPETYKSRRQTLPSSTPRQQLPQSLRSLSSGHHEQQGEGNITTRREAVTPPEGTGARAATFQCLIISLTV